MVFKRQDNNSTTDESSVGSSRRSSRVFIVCLLIMSVVLALLLRWGANFYLEWRKKPVEYTEDYTVTHADDLKACFGDYSVVNVRRVPSRSGYGDPDAPIIYYSDKWDIVWHNKDGLEYTYHMDNSSDFYDGLRHYLFYYLRDYIMDSYIKPYFKENAIYQKENESNFHSPFPEDTDVYVHLGIPKDDDCYGFDFSGGQKWVDAWYNGQWFNGCIPFYTANFDELLSFCPVMLSIEVAIEDSGADLEIKNIARHMIDDMRLSAGRNFNATIEIFLGPNRSSLINETYVGGEQIFVKTYVDVYIALVKAYEGIYWDNYIKMK